MSRRAWSRPYLHATLPDGATQDIHGTEIPAEAVKVTLRWRHPGSDNPRKRTAEASDSVAVADLLALAAAVTDAGAHPDRYTVAPDGRPRPVQPIPAEPATGLPAWPGPAPEPLSVTMPAEAAAIGVVAQSAPSAATVLPAVAMLQPGTLLRATAEHPLLAMVTSGAIAPGWTMSQLIESFWDAFSLRQYASTHPRDIETHLNYLRQFFTYEHPQPGDPDDVVTWKLARMRAVGAQVGQSMHVALLLPSDFDEFHAYRRSYDARIARSNAAAVTRYEKALARWEKAGRPGPAPEPPQLREQAPVTDRTVQATMNTLGALMNHARARGLFYAGDPWSAFQHSGPSGRSPVTRPATTRVDQRHVLTIGDALALADAVGRAGPTVDGEPLGARYRFAVILAATAGLRPSEMWGLPPDAVIDIDGTPHLRVAEPLVRSTKAFTGNGSDTERRDRLKQRGPGEARYVPLPTEVARLWDEHVARYASDEFAFTSRLGRAVRWGNDGVAVWRPALQAAFEGRHRIDLSDLRKVAVTWWLRSGIDHHTAAQRAGHSVQVQLTHYAGVVDGGEIRRYTTIDDAYAWASREVRFSR